MDQESKTTEQEATEKKLLSTADQYPGIPPEVFQEIRLKLSDDQVQEILDIFSNHSPIAKANVITKQQMEEHLSAMKYDRKPACNIYTKYLFYKITNFPVITEERSLESLASTFNDLVKATTDDQSKNTTQPAPIKVEWRDARDRVGFIFSISPDDNKKWLESDLYERYDKLVDDVVNTIKDKFIKCGVQSPYNIPDVVKQIPNETIWVTPHLKHDEILWAYSDTKVNDKFYPFDKVSHLINPTKLYWVETHYPYSRVTEDDWRSPNNPKRKIERQIEYKSKDD